jgi:hypothetical protein
MKTLKQHLEEKVIKQYGYIPKYLSLEIKDILPIVKEWLQEHQTQLKYMSRQNITFAQKEILLNKIKMIEELIKELE